MTARAIRNGLRKLFSFLPQERRFALYRSHVDCDPSPSDKLHLKIAETREELEACFRLLHDAYVDSGFMQPHASGLRVTPYHALPSTTTLCALWEGRVVGTISLIREDNAFGFPLHRVFDLNVVRARPGNIAEVSALAVHPRFRRVGGPILFPLMKFMYEYATRFFDTRHLVIAVHPNRIEMYESLLFFKRLNANVLENYDFANGAPAVGAWIDLQQAPQLLERAYAGKPPRKNLYAYFIDNRLPNIRWPERRYFTTNDPVLTPALLDYFFNRRTHGFADLDDHQKAWLHDIYDTPAYAAVLPALPQTAQPRRYREHNRCSFKCNGQWSLPGQPDGIALSVVDVSRYGFLAAVSAPPALQVWGDVLLRLGHQDVATLKARAVRRHTDADFYGFELGEPDIVWTTFIETLLAR